jgi:hypothetical protein
VFIGHSDDGGDRHAIRLVSKMTFLFKFLAFLKPKLTELLFINLKQSGKMHNSNHVWTTFKMTKL